MIISTGINRMGRGLDYPNIVGPDSISLVTDVSAPGSDYTNASYSSTNQWGMNGCRSCQGLGDVTSDITSGNWSALPGDIITGLGTGDIGSYIIVGGLLLFVLPHLLKGGRSASRAASRKARLTGAIAQDQALLKAS